MGLISSITGKIKNIINVYRNKPEETIDQLKVRLERGKRKFFNMATICLGLITFLIVVTTIFMCLFSAHNATPVKGVEAEIIGYFESNYDYDNNKEPALVSIRFKNTNHFKVTVDFFVMYRDSKISSRKTVLLSPFEEKSYGNYYLGGLKLYKDIELGDISKDDLDINMTITCNSHSYFGFSNNK